MVEYNDIISIFQRNMRDGEAISFPVPIMKDSRLYDVFFVYGVDTLMQKVKAPYRCTAVFYDGNQAIELVDDPFDFKNITMNFNKYQHLDRFADNLLEARSIYGKVREEIALGKPGKYWERYTELVKKATQPCILPYYEAMGLQFQK